MSDGAELRDFAFRAHQQTVNGSTVGNGGYGVDIGIVDSVYRLPEEFGEDIRTSEPHRFIDTDEEMTRIHGLRVVSFASQFAPEATFHFYQAIDENGDVSVEAYENAIDQAIADGIDILNISAGNDWDVPVEADPFAQKPPEAIEEGITVVAAAGNDDGVPPESPVHSPAAVSSVISVGGVVTYCPESAGSVHDTPGEGPYYVEDGADADVFCGEQGCAVEGDCVARQSREAWDGNPAESRGEIDVLAPMAYPFETPDGDYQLEEGSSFAAPIVSGVLAEAYSDIRENCGRIPGPGVTKNVVEETVADGLADVSGLLNAYRLKSELEVSCLRAPSER